MFSSLAPQTVHVMFHSRTRRRTRVVTSEAVRSSTTIGHYSALVLSAPITIGPVAQAARDRLACADQASIALTDEQRRLLQIDCLYRRFLDTQIGCYVPLCYEAAYVCTVRKLAPVLLPHIHTHPLLTAIAAAVVTTVAVPSSSYHWVHTTANLSSFPGPTLGRCASTLQRHCTASMRAGSLHRVDHRLLSLPVTSRGLSDLDVQQCNCPAYRAEPDRSIGDIIDSLQRARLYAMDGEDHMTDLRQRLVLAGRREQQSAAQQVAVPHQLGDDSYRPQEEEETADDDEDDDNQYDYDE